MTKLKKGYSNNVLDKNDLAYEEEVEENGICELTGDTTIASYDFSGDAVQPVKDANNENTLKEETIPLADNRKGKNSANDISSPIDNEPFKYKRCYLFRESTLRMLNEIKAKHPDINVYLNKIIDEAIRHYYKNIFESSENKK